MVIHRSYGDSYEVDGDGYDLGKERCLRSSKISLPYHKVLLALSGIFFPSYPAEM